MARSALVSALAIHVLLPLRAAEGDLVWSFSTGGEVYGSPAMDSSGNLYFGSRDGSLYSTTKDGLLRWTRAMGDWVDSSPTLSDDESTVYCGSWDNAMYALASADGALRWRFETGSLIVASPALDSQGNLFFGSADGFFYSLDAQGGIRWSFLIGSELDSSPAVAGDGSVYVGAYDGLLYSFDNDGNLKWTFATGETVPLEDRRIKAPPTIDAYGIIYFGAGKGEVYALDADGNELWTFDAREEVDTGVALGANGSIIFASRDGFLYCLDEYGVMRWESYVGDVFYSTPAVDEFGRIYVGSYLGDGVSGVSVVSPERDILWDTLTLDYIDSSPLLGANGELYYGCYGGALFAVEANATLGASPWSRFGGSSSNQSRSKPSAPDFFVSPGFAAWLQSFGLFGALAAVDRDGDGDGWTVLQEYLLGGSPVVPDRRLIDSGWSETGVSGIVVEFARPLLESYFGVDLQLSTNLQEWSSASSSPHWKAEETVVEEVEGDAFYERVRIEISGEAPLFWRVAAGAR